MSLPDAKEMNYWSAYDSLKKEIQLSYEFEIEEGDDAYEISDALIKDMPAFYSVLVRRLGGKDEVIGAIDNILGEIR